MAVVREILAEVRDRGDDALRDLTERLDGVRPSQLSVPRDEWDAALGRWTLPGTGRHWSPQTWRAAA